MDKTFLVFVAIGMGFLYFVTTFVGDIQKEDEKYSNNDFDLEHKYDMYQKEDSVGRPVLNVLSADAALQKEAWNAVKLRDEYLSLFPDFSFMKKFLEERIQGEPLKASLLKQLSTVEDQFFSGAITADQAKSTLGTIK